ncbi:MAG: phage tail length tape measure family protein [Porticoccaceae bacterium]|nr:phage tail length tape measure family protein [Porticoccaceae bacterium]
MAVKPQVRVRLTPEGVTEVVNALRKVQSESDKTGRSAAKGFDGLSKSVSGLVSKLGLLAGGIAAGGIFAKFVSETRQAEQEQAQLAAVLQSTGEAAGYNRDQLNEMAASMSAASGMAAGDITQAQTNLLAFTGIVGEEFPRALQSAIDMAARTGMSITSAAETIGRALDVPSQGLTALSRQGFRFTDAQKAMAEALEASGRTAEAQGIILQALEESYGGAAAAARGTFGGSIDALKNTLNDLVSGGEGSLDGARDAVNELNERLSDPAVKASIDSLTAAIIRLGGAFGGALTEAVQFTQWVGEELAARIHGIGDQDVVRLEQRLDRLTKARGQHLLQRDLTLGVVTDAGIDTEIAEIRGKLERAYSAIEQDIARRQRGGGGGPPAAAAPPAPTIPIEFETPEQRRAREQGEREAKRAADQARREAERAAKEQARREQAAAQTAFDLEQRLLELRGQGREAQIRALDQELAKYRETFEAAGQLSEEAQRKLDELRAAQVQRIDFDAQVEEARRALDELAATRARIEQDVQLGVTTQMAGQERILALEQERLPILQALAAEAMKIAAATGDPTIVAQAEAINRQIGEVAVSVKRASDRFVEFRDSAKSAVTSDLSNWLTDGIKGADSLGDAFKNLANSIAQSLQRIAADIAARKIADALLGSSMPATGGGGGGGGGSGWFSTAMAWAATLFMRDGGMVRAADGGHINGPGTGTSDSIPAMLSDGEFVVRAKAVKQPGVLQMLEAINSMQLRPVPRFATGGLVSADDFSGPAAGPAAALGTNITVNVTGVQDERQGRLAGAAIARQIRRSTNNSRYD